MAAPQAAGRFKEVGKEDITRLRGMLFGTIKQMQHVQPNWTATLIQIFLNMSLLYQNISVRVRPCLHSRRESDKESISLVLCARKTG